LADERKQLDFWRQQEQQKLENLDARAFGGKERLGSTGGAIFLPPPAARPTILIPAPADAPRLPVYGGKTSGLLITNEGQNVRFRSQEAASPYDNYESAGHVEGQAALWIRQNGSSGGALYHNHPNGTCWTCYSHLETLLPKGSVLTFFLEKMPYRAIIGSPNRCPTRAMTMCLSFLKKDRNHEDFRLQRQS
jgi:hypothetical protein